eukprot:CAMPEP_0114594506 /NCGR_PEP_ID=MMETSP0125-20121206/16163_1 /TAXON_ID=485358 ORGANISM="Aristerostoma sp., Strain ATCC 50986" /NCGR_SAMPLE_ID=MMETSP0125 /ASSEMBLY_ACC=CAM_ASM_000245 /LENGTH=306 /DNA_ID=CAMNT_0001794879 /DNA_START=1332 /DNA_END=2252 /DNA_ORIENTATION=+
MAFVISYHKSTINRHKKPFNPILGETYEFLAPDGSYKFVSEQVSHHPPISAGHAEGPDFVWYGDTNIKSQFWGKSMEVTPLGTSHVILKKFNEHFTYKRPVTSVQNIIFGKMYIDHHGEVPFNNITTGDSGILDMKKRGWTGSDAYVTTGNIKDKTGKVRYTIDAKWDSYFTVIDAQTKKKIKIWEGKPLPEGNREQFYFSMFARQLNYLHADMVKKLPPTDCRLRPDQRALEYGNNDLAKSEKHRLEEKQRARRKELKEKNEVHKMFWFQETTDSITGEKIYKYKGNYWEKREKGDFKDCLDLFT